MGQFWYQQQGMPRYRAPQFIGHLRVLVDFDMEDLEIARMYTPRSDINHPHMQDAWYIDGNMLVNPAPYSGYVEFGHYLMNGKFLPGQFFAQRAADLIARKYAEKTGEYIKQNVGSIFTKGEMTIHFKVSA